MMLTSDSLALVTDIAGRHGFGEAAGRAMAEALLASRGSMAQFNHADLGGMGQWSQGGMLMIGDMFNNGLKARVAALAQDLSAALASGDLVITAPAGASGTSQWWPDALGSPSSVGSQNGRRYAVFPETRRVAIDDGGRVRIYDSADHRIGGVSQQQGGASTLSFGTDRGQISVADLREVVGQSTADQAGRPNDEPRQQDSPPSRSEPSSRPSIIQSDRPAHADPLELLARLADLRTKGVITDEEFSAKKAELLSRI
jgi:hypothetical protein